MTTQCDRVLRYMRDTGSITAWEAMRELGVMRLASRINDLRRRGIDVRREMVTDRNRYGEPTRYARYRLNEKRAASDDTLTAQGAEKLPT